jgi:hypothetical protein
VDSAWLKHHVGRCLIKGDGSSWMYGDVPLCGGNNEPFAFSSSS